MLKDTVPVAFYTSATPEIRTLDKTPLVSTKEGRAECTYIVNHCTMSFHDFRDTFLLRPPHPRFPTVLLMTKLLEFSLNSVVSSLQLKVLGEEHVLSQDSHAKHFSGTLFSGHQWDLSVCPV